MAAKDSETIAVGMGVDITPRIHLTSDQVPAIKNWENGKKYKVQVELEQVSNQEGGYDGKQPYSADFKIVSVDGSDTKKTMDDDEDY